MSDVVDLTFKAGIPYRRRWVLTDGTNLWADASDCEVRCQVRGGTSTSTVLKMDLTPHLSVTIEGDNVVATLLMTGADTRVAKGGYYDMVISDTGTTDARAVRLGRGKISVEPTPTSAEDE